jgi:hypothetical protein
MPAWHFLTFAKGGVMRGKHLVVAHSLCSGQSSAASLSSGDSSMRSAEILESDGTQHLVVTHKSILRALLCVALNLPPVSFRAFDIHNAGVCTFR